MNILICGFTGKMGQAIYELTKQSTDLVVTEGLDLQEKCESLKNNFPNVNLISNIQNSKTAQVVIDFSFHGAIKSILDFCTSKKLPLVIGTTAHTEEELKLIENASKIIPIFKSSNYSQGVYVLVELIKNATKMLDGWDIEIVEKHHSKKLDTPSGTAKMMIDGVKSVKTDAIELIGRTKEAQKRTQQEIGVHSIRGGGIVGEHEIEFISNSETIKITHEAFSRNVFAEGCLKAVKFLHSKPAGLYQMKNLF